MAANFEADSQFGVMMNYGLEQPETTRPPKVRLPLKLAMVTATGLLNLLFFERFGRIFMNHVVWSGGVILWGVASVVILAAMHRALLWKWTCQKSWKAFSIVFVLAAVLPGSIGFYVGMNGLWESSH